MAAAAKLPPLPRKAYEAMVPRLREQLVGMQLELKAAPFPVLLVIAGVDGAGKGEVVSTLNAWLDPRGIETFAFSHPSDEECERPLFWRYWRCLPPRGRMGIYYSSWHTEALLAEVHDRPEASRFGHALERIAAFEQMLADDGTLILKVWLQISKEAQRRRFQDLERDPRTAWRVSAADWESHHLYERLARLSGRLLRTTDRPDAPWTILDTDDGRARNVAVAKMLVRRFREHARAWRRRAARTAAPAGRTGPLQQNGVRVLARLRLDQTLSAGAYEKKKCQCLARLNRLLFAARERRRSVVFVFEGWDAAGKGGAIRRLTSAMDAPFYRVIPVAAPTDEEKAHHYLWRFWRHLPRAGLVTIYDRSWYGRVLVERVEGFCTRAAWRRAYAEINAFEEQLTAHGLIVIKFWMHISKAEQLRRFRSRETTAYKRHKINAEDWRNRRRWTAYETCVGDMVALTSTRQAPWHLIPSDNKRHARLEILRTAVRELDRALAQP
jgi:polyphosphate:AMP phosphotransferase